MATHDVELRGVCVGEGLRTYTYLWSELLWGTWSRGLAGERILKIQASLTAHWHDKGADWRKRRQCSCGKVGGGSWKHERKKNKAPTVSTDNHSQQALVSLCGGGLCCLPSLPLGLCVLSFFRMSFYL